MAVLVAQIPHPIRRRETYEKVVALSFDDGPNPPYTERVLEVLKRYQARATFFLLGRNIDMHRASAERILEAGHELGNHSYWHRHLRWESPSRIETEIADTDRLIRSLNYQGPIPFRAPFGETFPGPWWASWCLHRPLYLFDVSPDPADYLRADPQNIARHMLDVTRPGSVLLFHDGEGIRTESVIALEDVLRGLRERGYRFVPVSELFSNTSALK